MVAEGTLAGKTRKQDSLLNLAEFRGEEQRETEMGGKEQIPSSARLHAYLSTFRSFTHLDPQNGLSGYQLEVFFHCNNNA